MVCYSRFYFTGAHPGWSFNHWISTLAVPAAELHAAPLQCHSACAGQVYHNLWWQSKQLPASALLQSPSLLKYKLHTAHVQVHILHAELTSFTSAKIVRKDSIDSSGITHLSLGLFAVAPFPHPEGWGLPIRHSQLPAHQQRQKPSWHEGHDVLGTSAARRQTRGGWWQWCCQDRCQGST